MTINIVSINTLSFFYQNQFIIKRRYSIIKNIDNAYEINKEKLRFSC